MLKFLMMAMLFLSSCQVIKAPISSTVMSDQWVCRPDVIQAMNLAWQKSAMGISGTEAGFRIDISNNNNGYVIVPHRFTNQYHVLSIEIEPWTVAEFHIHPNSDDAEPSTPGNNYLGNSIGDTGLADKYMIDMYTYNRQGLYVYRWKTKEILLLRKDSNWLRPCKKLP